VVSVLTKTSTNEVEIVIRIGNVRIWSLVLCQVQNCIVIHLCHSCCDDAGANDEQPAKKKSQVD